MAWRRPLTRYRTWKPAGRLGGRVGSWSTALSLRRPSGGTRLIPRKAGPAPAASAPATTARSDAPSPAPTSRPGASASATTACGRSSCPDVPLLKPRRPCGPGLRRAPSCGTLKVGPFSSCERVRRRVTAMALHGSDISLRRGPCSPEASRPMGDSPATYGCRRARGRTNRSGNRWPWAAGQ